MFKFQEQLDIMKDEDVSNTLPTGEVARSRQQRSRMFINHKAVKNSILDQIEENDIKKKVDKLHDLKLGQEMAYDANSKL
jgi:hypothetical protein